MDLSFSCANVNVSANNGRTVTVDINDVSSADILNEIDIKDAISHYGKDELLKLIGETAARKYFEIPE